MLCERKDVGRWVAVQLFSLTGGSFVTSCLLRGRLEHMCLKDRYLEENSALTRQTPREVKQRYHSESW